MFMSYDEDDRSDNSKRQPSDTGINDAGVGYTVPDPPPVSDASPRAYE